MFVIKVFILFQTQEIREVYHFQYITWPDFGIPSSPVSFLMFLEAVRQKGVLEDNVGPSVIHCSAGIGRSGTFCLVDSALVLVRQLFIFKHFLKKLKQNFLILGSYQKGLICLNDLSCLFLLPRQTFVAGIGFC